MLQKTVGKIIIVIHIVILVYVSKHASGFTPNECESIENVYQRLETAEQIIKSAKEKLPANLQSPLPLDCEELLNYGERKSGVYLVWPKNRILPGPTSVYCDMDTDGGGWTVIQRRGNFSRDKLYFHQDWKAYKEGFGNLKEDFWLGNDYIYALSNQKQYSVRFDLGDFEGNKRYAMYDSFWTDNEENNYTLHVSGYSGDAGDSLSYHEGCKFTTKDRDNDNNSNNCAQDHKGAWWYNTCFNSNINGEYLGSKNERKWQGVIWFHWKGESYSLATTEMKIKRNPSWIK